MEWLEKAITAVNNMDMVKLVIVCITVPVVLLILTAFRAVNHMKRVDFFLKRLDSSKHLSHENLKEELELVVRITRILTATRVTLGTSRLLVYEFHNGNVKASKRAYLKSSCTFEDVEPGVSRMIGHFKDTDISELAEWIDLVSKHKVVYRMTEEMTGKPLIRLREYGTTEVIVVGLYSGIDLVGLISAECVRGSKFQLGIEESKRIMLDLSAQLSKIIEDSTKI